MRKSSRTLRPLLLQLPRVNFSGLTHQSGANQRVDRFLLRPSALQPLPGSQSFGARNYGMLAVRVLRGVMKLRYLLLGGAVTGGVSLNSVSIELVRTNRPVTSILPLITHCDRSATRSGKTVCRT